MKILYNIAGTRHSGGMERVLTNKANWLARHGYAVTIVTTDQHGEPPFFALDDKVQQIDLGIGYEDNNGKGLLNKLVHYPGKQRRHKKRLTQILKREKPDICISMFCNEVSFITKLRDGSKKVLEIHFSKKKRLQYGRKGLWRIADKLRSINDERLVRKFRHFIVLTEEDKTLWGSLPNIRVIPNANTFTPKLTSSLDEKKVIAVGRYTHQKGFERLIKAWAIVHKTNPDWKLEIIGDGEERQMLLQFIFDLGLSDCISLKPFTADMNSVYLGASIIAMSSRYEGLPMTLIESQAYGIPAVSFDCQCGPKDIINDGANGFLVPEGDCTSLANRLCQLIEDENLRKQMGAAAKLASKRYDEEAIMNQWEELFNA